MSIQSEYRAKRKLNGEWVFGSYINIGEDWCQIVPSGTEYDEIDSEKTRVITNTVGLYFGRPDKNGVKIYQGDIIELINDEGVPIRVLCEYGTVQRRIVAGNGVANLCDITGFYFRTETGHNTFPIFENYLGKNDVEIFEVIGNIIDNPELFKRQN